MASTRPPTARPSTARPPTARPPTARPSTAPTVFITGAAAGIGRATALRFARAGYRVGAYDVDLPGLATLNEEITAGGGEASTGELDVTDADAWARQLKAFTGSSGRWTFW